MVYRRWSHTGARVGASSSLVRVKAVKTTKKIVKGKGKGTGSEPLFFLQLIESLSFKLVGVRWGLEGRLVAFLWGFDSVLFVRWKKRIVLVGVFGRK